jgi:DNA replication and repair protein RecF
VIIKSLELTDYRNYDHLNIEFDSGTNIFYGDNAQGKTNILEAIYIAATTKSHKGSRDSEIIGFGKDEAHIRTVIENDGIPTRVDMHLRSAKTKGIAIDGNRIKKAAELMGLCKVVFFSPEDLNIVKNGPSYRRRFIDMELCQLDSFYLYNLNNYNKVLNRRNQVLKDLYFDRSLEDSLVIWDDQLISYGTKIIERRRKFAEELEEQIKEVHSKLSGGREEINIIYEPSVSEEDYETLLKSSRSKDLKSKMTGIGPHRDDFSFMTGEIDIRKYGSQGQQRTAALSLKLSEIDMMKKLSGDNPILLLDDVLSELDRKRQGFLLDSIGDIQTFITCTGIDDFVNDRFVMNRVFYVENGTVKQMS